MKLPKLIKLRTFKVPPKSTNNIYFPIASKRLVKSYSYKLFRNIMNKIIDGDDGFLPRDMSDYGLYVEVGVCKEFDLDNTLKGVIDALQEAYEFNDNQINMLLAKKVIIGNYPLTRKQRLEQYVKVGLFELTVEDKKPLDPSNLSSLAEPFYEIRPTDLQMNLLLDSTSGDQVEIGETKSGSPIYLEVTLDLENAIKKLGFDGGIERLIKVIRDTEKDQYLIKNVAKKLGIEEKIFRSEIHNRINSEDDLEAKLDLLKMQ